ncbi:MAG: phosphoribosylglycinamide formyltransferase [Acidobacteriaceae bacterium]
MRGNKMRIAALISGGGTTMQKVIQACKSGQLAYAEVVCVIASNVLAGGIEKALVEGLPPSKVIVTDPRWYGGCREAFGQALRSWLRCHEVDFVAQLGWLPLTPSTIIEKYGNMMINQHPGPLRPDHRDFGGKGMYGRRVHSARLNFVGVTQRNFWTEAVSQRVAKDFDQGTVIKMRRVPIYSTDEVPTLQARVLPVEHEVQIEAIDDFSQNRVAEVVFENDNLVHSWEDPVLAYSKAHGIRNFPQG